MTSHSVLKRRHLRPENSAGAPAKSPAGGLRWEISNLWHYQGPLLLQGLLVKQGILVNQVILQGNISFKLLFRNNILIDTTLEINILLILGK